MSLIPLLMHPKAEATWYRLGVRISHSNLGRAVYQLCDIGQVTRSPQASVFLHRKYGAITAILVTPQRMVRDSFKIVDGNVICKL